jgi:nucleoside 2-deoxyribosyltransferase
MKIYFAGSIRGGRDDWSLYKQIIGLLSQYGEVLTEHIGDSELSITGEDLPDREIHERDLAWLKSCDCLVAEVTRPSLGVGYEIGKATEWGKQVLCVYRESVTPKLSAMIAGAESVELQSYRDVVELKAFFEQNFKTKLKN